MAVFVSNTDGTVTVLEDGESIGTFPDVPAAQRALHYGRMEGVARHQRSMALGLIPPDDISSARTVYP